MEVRKDKMGHRVNAASTNLTFLSKPVMIGVYNCYRLSLCITGKVKGTEFIPRLKPDSENSTVRDWKCDISARLDSIPTNDIIQIEAAVR